MGFLSKLFGGGGNPEARTAAPHVPKASELKPKDHPLVKPLIPAALKITGEIQDGKECTVQVLLGRNGDNAVLLWGNPTSGTANRIKISTDESSFNGKGGVVVERSAERVIWKGVNDLPGYRKDMSTEQLVDLAMPYAQLIPNGGLINYTEVKIKPESERQ